MMCFVVSLIVKIASEGLALFFYSKLTAIIWSAYASISSFELPASIGYFSEIDNAAQVVSKIAIKRFDDIFQELDITGQVFIKIDTEGFEHRVLRGMQNFLRKKNITGILVEVTDKWLNQEGTSALDLFNEMSSFGYHAYLPVRSFKYNLFKNVDFKILKSPLNQSQYDVLFTRQALSTSS